MMEKNQLRQELKQRLRQMPQSERTSQSKRVCEQIISSEVFKKASVVMVFLPLSHEVDTTPLILSAWQQGKTVAVPKVSWEQRHMIPIEISSLEIGLKTDHMGIRTPTNGVPVPFDQIDLVITPGLGFDPNGNRLGRGGAFYDTFFRHDEVTATRWAVAYSQQICDEIPHNDRDIPVDAIVTENEIIMCKEN